MSSNSLALTWLRPGQPFPAPDTALDASTGYAGLLCGGGDLDVATLQRAYSSAIFPWFSAGQPLLWWSPDPRMVLTVEHFRMHPSFRKTLKRFMRASGHEIRVDSAFSDVITACAKRPRPGQSATWIVPEMINAYTQLHGAGLAHSVETWIDDTLVGGLYFVTLGKTVFGESMFHCVPDSSKIALAALVAMCREFGVTHIDCQQNTRHLASLGAAEMPRRQFVQIVRQACPLTSPRWRFAPVYWKHVFSLPTAAS